MRKIFIFIGLFFLFIGHSFALNADLTLDKNLSNINDYINLRLKVTGDNLSQIKEIKIAGLENFEKLGQSQSQSSSTQVVIINGKTQSKATTTVNLDLTLKALKNGEFEIGPAIIDTGSGKIETNTVKIKVDGTNIGIGNNNLNIGNNLSKKKNIGNNNLQTSNDLEKKQDINLDDYKKDNSEFYILILVLILFSLGFYFFIKNNFFKSTKYEFKDNEISGDDKVEDFEEKNVEIVYPNIEDKDFIKKAEIVLKQKLKQKYNINNVESLTFGELEKELKDKLDLTELFAMINKAKYSNIITDYSKILEQIKNI